MDAIAGALLLLGVVFVAAGLLPSADAWATLRRVGPLLAFLATVIVLAELTADAEVFDVVAARLARTARGGYPALFGLCVLFAAVTTIVLNLDTTAVLLTPVMIALARRLDVPPLPFAATTVWLANTASLLLPVSNLTNLLAADRASAGTAAFAARMWAPQLAAVAVVALCLWGFFWRRGRRGAARYVVPSRRRPQDAVRFRVAAAACGGFAVAVAAGVRIEVASAAAAAVVVAAAAVREPARLSWSLVPWQLLVLVTGLFLVMQTISVHGLTDLMRALVGGAQGFPGLLRTAGVGGALANTVNNLPAYLAGEAAVPLDHHTQLLALLIGTNVGSVVLPWASLATLLWYERCRAQGVRVDARTFTAVSAVPAVLCVVAAVAALAVAG